MGGVTICQGGHAQLVSIGSLAAVAAVAWCYSYVLIHTKQVDVA